MSTHTVSVGRAVRKVENPLLVGLKPAIAKIDRSSVAVSYALTPHDHCYRRSDLFEPGASVVGLHVEALPSH